MILRCRLPLVVLVLSCLSSKLVLLVTASSPDHVLLSRMLSEKQIYPSPEWLSPPLGDGHQPKRRQESQQPHQHPTRTNHHHLHVFHDSFLHFVKRASAVALKRLTGITFGSSAFRWLETVTKYITSELDYPYFNFWPVEVGAVSLGVSTSQALSWDAPCLGHNTVRMERLSDNVTLELVFEASQKKQWFCEDLYLLATVDSFLLKSVSSEKRSTVTWAIPENEPARWDLQTKGIRIFRFQVGRIHALYGLIKTIELLESDATASAPLAEPSATSFASVEFLRSYMDLDYVARGNQRPVHKLNKRDVAPGDVFGVTRLGGLDPLLAWLLGTDTTHTAVAMEIDGDLHVTEATRIHPSHSIQNATVHHGGVRSTPIAKWIEMNHLAGYITTWMPISRASRKRFENTRALEFFAKVDGLDFGYQTLFAGYLDTINAKQPCLPPEHKTCLTWSSWEIFWAFIAKLDPKAGHLLVGEAWNLRLNRTNLTVPEVLQHAGEQGFSGVGDLVTVVEQDEWGYNVGGGRGEMTQGPAMSSQTFVCRVWKAGGLFEHIDNDFHCAELTIEDLYKLSILDPQIPVQCDKDEMGRQHHKQPICQVTGEYSLRNMDKRGFAEVTPYKRMGNFCAV